MTKTQRTNIGITAIIMDLAPRRAGGDHPESIDDDLSSMNLAELVVSAAELYSRHETREGYEEGIEELDLPEETAAILANTADLFYPA